MRRHTRREVIKRGVKTVGNVVWYGTILGALGKAYDVIGRATGLIVDTARQGVEIGAKKAYENDERVREEPGKYRGNVATEDLRSRFYRRLTEAIGIAPDLEKGRESLGVPHSKGYKPKHQEQKPEEEKITRRNLFQYILSLAHRHPVGAGIVGGASYGIGKSILAGRKDLRIARLEDETEALRDAQGNYNQQKGLEGRVGKPLTAEEVKYRIEEGKDLYFIVGGIGLLAVIFFSLTNITGNTILDLSKTQFSLFNILIFLASLILIYLGVRFK